MSEHLIVCRGLSKAYGPKVALSGVDLEVGRGRIGWAARPQRSGKTTLIKLLCGLLQPTTGTLEINGQHIGSRNQGPGKLSARPDVLCRLVKATDLFDLFRDFYQDFDYDKALAMCRSLGVEPKDRLKSMSKGTKEKVQLVLVMARKAQLYLLDEPIAGVDPAARDFILHTILTNYNEEARPDLHHLIADIEKVLDEVIFLKSGRIMLHSTVDDIRSGRARAWTPCSARFLRPSPWKEVCTNVRQTFEIRLPLHVENLPHCLARCPHPGSGQPLHSLRHHQPR